MNVLGLCSYPVESASTRYRLLQFAGPLAERGIDLQVSPFLSSDSYKTLHQPGNILLKALAMTGPGLRRLSEVFRVRKYDLLFVQREAIFFGPAFFERLFQIAGNMPLVLDLDDATYVPYISPTYGRVGSAFKFFGKTDSLIRQARMVTCGNQIIADYVEEKGTPARVIPTVVNTDEFCPAEKGNDIPVIGWIGSSSTFPFLEHLLPVLQELAKKHRFILKIVGAGRTKIEAGELAIENLPWSLEREVADFRSLDIGLYPLIPNEMVKMEWIVGKSGFKAIQYMAVGIPFVMSPAGVCAGMGQPNLTHFNAVSDEDWYNALDRLLSDEGLRQKMGAEGRSHSLRHYTIPLQVEALVEVFNFASKK